MRYLVTARVKPGRHAALMRSIRDGSLGEGSVAGGEYLRNMDSARRLPDGRVQWVEICYCAEPLAEERPYWEAYFDVIRVIDAHARSHCKHETGEEVFACRGCDCTVRLDERLSRSGERFLDTMADQK